MPAGESPRASSSAAIDLDNAEFRVVQQLIENTNNSVFMTGRAGTGKSTFLRHIIATTKKKSVVLAPTGIAAVNVNGQTLHSFFRIPFKPILPDDPDFSYRRLSERLKYSAAQIKLLREIQLIVIDEISMVRSDIIDIIDKILRKFTGNMRQPFGGKQLLMVGDIFQLEPVVTGETRDVLGHAYTSFYFFNAFVFRNFCPVCVELRKLYRQGDDAAFAQLLDRVRLGCPQPADISILNSRYRADCSTVAGDNESMVMTLCSQRSIASAINDRRLNEINAHQHEYQCTIVGKFNADALPAEKELHLKVGAQVIFVKNDMDRRWVNGTIGRVEECDDDCVKVRTEDDVLHTVQREVWENIHYTYNEDTKKVEEEVLGTFTQFPLRLAWAITIHKSQGMTFSNVIIDIGRGAFTAGMTYVALSRCRTLQGIRLRTTLSERDIYVRQTIIEYARRFNDNSLVEKTLNNARADSKYVEACRLADSRRWPEASAAFMDAMQLRNEAANPMTRRLMSLKLREFTHLNKRIAELQAQLDDARKMLREISDEHVKMALWLHDESDDLDNATANIEKALHIDPLNVGAYVEYARLKLDQGDVDAADMYAGIAEKTAGDVYDREVNRVLADISQVQGDPIRSMSYLLIIDEHEPSYKDNIRRIADLYDEMGEDETAASYRKRLRKK